MPRYGNGAALSILPVFGGTLYVPDTAPPVVSVCSALLQFDYTRSSPEEAMIRKAPGVAG